LPVGEYFTGDIIIMTSKIVAALAALAFATAANAAPLQVSPVPGGGIGASAAQQIRHHRHGRYYFKCPVWYERTFWGPYRLYSPCTRKANPGQY
jgi:hypothetical protein